MEDQVNDSVSKTPWGSSPDAVSPGLRWPPPGLERTQGDLFVIASRSALAGGFMALPLLFVSAREQHFASFGPFADAWWVMLLLTTIGLTFGLDAIMRLSRSLRRAGRAIGRGYDLTTITRVLADNGRDMGFLLSGARHFSVVDARERYAIASIRVASAMLVAGAGLWLTLSLAVGLFASARGVLTPTGLQMLTLAPAVVAYVCGLVAAMVQEGRVRRARRVWFKQPWADDLATDEINAWQTSLSDGGGNTGGGEGGARMLGLAGAVVAVLSVAVLLPALTLAPASAVAPILTAVTAPASVHRPRAARAEAFRSFAVDGDVSISAEEAGDLLQVLLHVATERELSQGGRAPSRVIAQPWLPDPGSEGNPIGLEPFMWGDSLIVRVADGVTDEQRAYLTELSSHPASADYSRLARATAMDAGSARWDTPFPSGTTMATVPVPRFQSLRTATNVHVAAAAAAFLDGRHDEAEVLLSEVIAVGFLLVDEGPTLIDNLIGVTLVETGGGALVSLFRATGRTSRAAEVSRLRQVAERASGMVWSHYPETPEAFVRSLPGMILDTALVRGMRWELFINLATVAPCLNVHNMVFGTGDDYDAFVEEARAALVRYPSDEALFELARHGWVGTADPGSPTPLGRVASLFMNTGENSCAAMVRHMSVAESFPNRPSS